MNSLVLVTAFIGNLTITGYQSLAKDTDDTPFITATGERVCPDGIAVSQDLLVKNGGPLNFGDWVVIEGIGLKKINDVMNKRHKKAIDIWCPNRAAESRIFKRFNNGRTRVWVISRTIKESNASELLTAR